MSVADNGVGEAAGNGYAVALQSVFVFECRARTSGALGEGVVGRAAFGAAEYSGSLAVGVVKYAFNRGNAFGTREVVDAVLSHRVDDEQNASIACAFQSFVGEAGGFMLLCYEGLVIAGACDPVTLPVADCGEHYVDIYGRDTVAVDRGAARHRKQSQKSRDNEGESCPCHLSGGKQSGE